MVIGVGGTMRTDEVHRVVVGSAGTVGGEVDESHAGIRVAEV